MHISKYQINYSQLYPKISKKRQFVRYTNIGEIITTILTAIAAVGFIIYVLYFM
jgi:hypothetical protein